MSSRCIALVLAVVAMATTHPARAQTPSPTGSPAPAWRDDVVALLETRARAVERGDRATFERTMSLAPRSFKDDKLVWFGRVRALELSAYELELDDDDSYQDLVAALDEQPENVDEVHVVDVTERIGIAGYDEEPSAESIFLTVVRRGSTWSIVADDDLEDLGILSSRNLWDFAPVRRLERGGVLVLFHDEPTQAAAIRDAEREAIAYVQRRWPLGWRARAIVTIPSTTGELSRIFGTPVDLGPFVAFTSSSVERDDAGGFELVGHRLSVQPGTFFETGERFRDDTMSHETLHLATRPFSGPWTPAWADEGVAQIYGERSTVPTDALAAAVRRGTLDGLPEEYEFFTGGRDRIRAAYQSSASFIAFLRARFGANAGATLYKAIGAESAVSFGTARYHAERAVRSAFKRSLRALEQAWLTTLRRRYA